MEKNRELSATFCETRNDVATALEQKKAVIIIYGSAYNEFKEQAEKDYKRGSMKKAIMGGGGLIALGTLVLPIAVAFLGGAMILGKALNLSTKDFKKYRYSFHTYGNEPCMILIRDTISEPFYPKFDTIKEYNDIRFTSTDKCIECGKKLDKEKFKNFQVCVCPDCKTKHLQLYKR